MPFLSMNDREFGAVLLSRFRAQIQPPLARSHFLKFRTQSGCNCPTPFFGLSFFLFLFFFGVCSVKAHILCSSEVNLFS